MFTQGPKIRVSRWEYEACAGGLFLGPCGRPMRVPAKQELILLRGKPARDGASEWTFESIESALRAGNLSAWFYILQTLYAGKAPRELAYKFGSHDISCLPIHFKDDNIGYESEDDSRGWGPGKNPLAKGTPPAGVIRPSKDKIYFNHTHYNKIEDPRKALKERFEHDISKAEILMLKCLGHLGNITEMVSAILDHGNQITPDTLSPCVITFSTLNRLFGTSMSSASASPTPLKRKQRTATPSELTKRQKNLQGVVADVDSTDFEEDEDEEDDNETDDGGDGDGI